MGAGKSARGRSPDRSRSRRRSRRRGRRRRRAGNGANGRVPKSRPAIAAKPSVCGVLESAFALHWSSPFLAGLPKSRHNDLRNPHTQQQSGENDHGRGTNRQIHSGKRARGRSPSRSRNRRRSRCRNPAGNGASGPAPESRSAIAAKPGVCGVFESAFALHGRSPFRARLPDSRHNDLRNPRAQKQDDRNRRSRSRFGNAPDAGTSRI